MTHLSKAFTHLDVMRVVYHLIIDVKTRKARRKARIVISEDKDAEDPSKQRRSLIEELDMNVDISLVPSHAADQGRKSNDTQAKDKGKAVMQESESTKKIKKRIQAQMSIDEELARKLYKEKLERTVQEVKRQSTKEETRKKSNDINKPTRKKTLARKRAGGNNSQKSVKKQKLEDDTEKKELKAYLDIVQKIIWKLNLWQLNGSSKNHKIFSETLDDFHRPDVMDLHRLVEERYTTISPEGYDLMLWGDLKTLLKPDEENKLWKNQHEYNLISWRLLIRVTLACPMRLKDIASRVYEAGSHGVLGEVYGTVSMGAGVRGSSLEDMGFWQERWLLALLGLG
nr:hypothetical protein [Tanacetum cinerariifolium]